MRILVWKNLFFGILKLKPADYFHKNVIDYDFFSQSTSTLNENLPKNFTYQNFWDWQPTPSILVGRGEIEVLEWRGSRRNYNLKLSEKRTVFFQGLYFKSSSVLTPLNTFFSRGK